MKKVAVIMGSDSDLPVVEAAFPIFEQYGVPFEAHVFSAHRTPEMTAAFASAGMAAHLAGAIAAQTTVPVIGIPIKSSALDGLDALLSTVQMPPGIPVATVGINGAANAAILAVQILSLSDIELADKLDKNRQEMKNKVLSKDQSLQSKIAK